MKLSKLKGELRSVAVPIGDVGTLNVNYYPAKFTEQLQTEMAALEARVKAKQTSGEALEGEEATASAALLMRLMDSWDLEDEKGAKIAPTADILVNELGYININRITTAIMESLNPNA